MRVKLNLLLALSHRAEVLILDEPTSGLNPFSRDEHGMALIPSEYFESRVQELMAVISTQV